jgi:hypothetical protein
MKAFLVGCIFLVSVGVLAVLGQFFYPFLMLFVALVGVLLSLCLTVLAIWGLGKLLLFLWAYLRKK